MVVEWRGSRGGGAAAAVGRVRGLGGKGFGVVRRRCRVFGKDRPRRADDGAAVVEAGGRAEPRAAAVLLRRLAVGCSWGRARGGESVVLSLNGKAGRGR